MFKKSLVTIVLELLGIPLQASILWFVARRLNIDEQASYYYLMALTQILATLAGLNLSESLLYYCSRESDLKDRSVAIHWLTQSVQAIQAVGILLLLCLASVTPWLKDVIKLSLMDCFAVISLVASRNGFMVLFRYLNVHGRFNTAAILQVGVNGLGPFLAVLVLPFTGADHLLLWAAALTVAGSALIMIAGCPEILWLKQDYSGLGPQLRRFYLYGIPRLPVALGMSVLFSAPPIIGQFQGLDATQVAALGFSATVVRTLAFVQRLSTTFILPKVAATSQDLPALQRVIRMGLVAIPFLGVMTAFGCLALGNTIMARWTKLPFDSIPAAMPILWLAAGLAASVYLIRPLIDGLSETAFNTRSLLASTTIFLVASFTLGPLMGPTLGVSLGFLVACLVFLILSWRTVHQLTGISLASVIGSTPLDYLCIATVPLLLVAGYCFSQVQVGLLLLVAITFIGAILGAPMLLKIVKLLHANKKPGNAHPVR
jgi:O-antigen/teichoic acid export membrane protein